MTYEVSGKKGTEPDQGVDRHTCRGPGGCREIAN